MDEVSNKEMNEGMKRQDGSAFKTLHINIYWIS